MYVVAQIGCVLTQLNHVPTTITRDHAMKPIAATLLAAALGAAFSSAWASDAATYRSLTQKATADYKRAAANCAGKSGNEHTICQDEAKLARARANADAVAGYNNTLKARSAARNALANAEFALAKSKCA